MLHVIARRISLTVALACLAHGHLQARGIMPDDVPDAALINAGRALFLKETFAGNGRTCATCHPEDHNFTIDPAFIATLSADDPLFAAERAAPNPLATDFEKPALLRGVGLILENTNGFGDLAHDFTMRSVPHLLALRGTLAPPSTAADDGTITPPDARTGWSGDGAPVDAATTPPLRGTLRDFTVGAIRQHFTRTLNRQAGTDFRLPTAYELDALEAFMLSLGRQREYDDFTAITLHDSRAERGRQNYLGAGIAHGPPCNVCHFNGGANTDPSFSFPPEITPPAFEETNRSFAPRVEELLDQPGDIVDAGNNPFDDGFGHGSDLFNVPPVIEAADTGPFFHANQVDTVEGLVAFYAAQRHLRDGTVLPPIIGLNASQIVNIAAFLRVLNADENARSALDLIDRAGRLRARRDSRINMNLARAEVEDAIGVLEGGRLHYADAVPLFRTALDRIRADDAQAATNALAAARRAMIER